MSVNLIATMPPIACCQIETLDTVKKTLVDNRPSSFEDCVSYARHLWQENYHNQISQLLFNFPADQVRQLGDEYIRW